MKVVATVLAVGALSLCLAGTSSAATMTGYISDTKCATAGAAKKTAAEWIQPAAFEKCVKDCVKDGSEAVFVTEDNKILKFDAASKQKIAEFLGKKVSVTGTVKDGTLLVDSARVLKLN